MSVLAVSAACGVDKSVRLEERVTAGCPGLVKPGSVATITKDFEVSQVVLERDSICTVSLQDGRKALFIGLIGYPNEELAEQQTVMQCPGVRFDGPDKSCSIASRDGGKFRVNGVAGRFEVKVAVGEVPVNDEVKGAAYQILTDLRSSDGTKWR